LGSRVFYREPEVHPGSSPGQAFAGKRYGTQGRIMDLLTLDLAIFLLATFAAALIAG